MNGWIDISVPLRAGMVVWPGDPEVRLTQLVAFERGDMMNLTAVSMCLHSGTHVDAPLHFLAGGASMDALPLDALIGEARVIDIRNDRAITAEELRPHAPARGERLLFRTRNSERCWITDNFVEDHVAISAGAARYLVQCGVRAVGIDYLSVGGEETHRILLGAGIWCIEGLNLAPAAPGRCELVCLPLRVAGAEGAPARAILRPL